MRPEVGGQQCAVSCSHAVATPPHSVGAPLFVAGTPIPIVGLHGRHADICRSEAGIETLGPVEVVLRLVDATATRSEEHTSELQSRLHLVCRLLLEKKKKNTKKHHYPTPNHSTM